MTRTKIFGVLFSLFLLVSVPAGVYLALTRTSFFNQASGSPANLYIDAGSAFENRVGTWKNLAQGGEEKGRMLASVIPQTKRLQSEYIRIDHLYDLFDVVQKDSSGNINFNWTNLDQTVNDIGAIGATPFFSLSYMPPSVAKDGDITNIPNNWADWELIVQKTIEHYSGKNGMNLKNVYYEVWNEPDLFGKFKIGGDKNYLTLYSHSAIGAARTSGVNSFKFGGPASTDLYKNWFDSMLKFTSNNNIRIDFFSWHKYSKNIDDYQGQVLNIKNWLLDYPEYSNLEFIVSEIGINGANDPGYDNGFSGMHTIATAAVLENTVSKMFTFEIKDGVGDKQYWGRWGLLTNDKFGEPQIKPRYNALLFLNRMIGNRVNVVGQGSWVKSFAKNDGKTIRILVVNYDSLGSHTEVVPIRIDNLINQDYTIKRIDYGGGVRVRSTTVTAKVIDITEGFDPNTAAIFEITSQ